MSLKSECLSYMENAKVELKKESPKNEELIEELFVIFIDYVNADYNGVSDGKIYRIYLDTIKDMLYFAFENNASKSFMRSFFKTLNDKRVTDFLSKRTKCKSPHFKYALNTIVYEFVYWQESDNTKEHKLNHLINRINSWM